MQYECVELIELFGQFQFVGDRTRWCFTDAKDLICMIGIDGKVASNENSIQICLNQGI